MTSRIHDRYLFRQFVRIFLISVLSFTVIYITIDTFEEIDNFIDHDASIVNIVRYYIYSVPFMLTYIIPVSMLLGTIFSVGIMARRNELTAFIASGVSLMRIARPIFVVAVLVTVTTVFFNDLVVTNATRRRKEIKQHDIEGRARSNPFLRENFRYLGENGYVYLAARYNHETRTLFEVVLQQFDGNTLTRRIDARTAKWINGQWVFHSGFERVFESRSETVHAFTRLAMPDIRETPDNFVEKELDPENMNLRELAAYIKKVRKSGGNVERLLTDLYGKFSYPVAGSIFALIGIAFAAGKRKQSIATGFGLTLLISFIYYGVLQVGQTLGYNGRVPPLLAAELGNLLFLIIGTGLLVRANQ
ncbi:MAG: LPS export ABC transporter permease LptG [Candidatus Krumholzibacteriia bacterium]